MKNIKEQKQRYSGIGGQAVMEGVMMRNDNRYAVAVRKPEGDITVDVSSCGGNPYLESMKKVPFLRGVIRFAGSLVLGMRSLNYSASFLEEEEEKNRKQKTKEQIEKEDRAVMGLMFVISLVFALLLFFVLPYFLSTLLHFWNVPEMGIVLAEGVLRLGIFIGYIILISFNNDIRRLFMYHGAEHKCINCVERGLPLTVENVRASAKEHKRCGTSFLLIVMLISILLFMFIRVGNPWLQLLCRLLLIPVIAGISFEWLNLAGKTDHVVIDVLSAPGLWLQKLTTREPDDSMIEVGIASVEAVFDWRSWQSQKAESKKAERKNG